MRATLKRWWGGRDSPESTPSPPGRHRPLIDRDACTGCNRCVQACEQGCLEMVWDFATFTAPQRCSGEGHCAAACEQGVIRMVAAGR